MLVIHLYQLISLLGLLGVIGAVVQWEIADRIVSYNESMSCSENATQVIISLDNAHSQENICVDESFNLHFQIIVPTVPLDWLFNSFVGISNDDGDKSMSATSLYSLYSNSMQLEELSSSITSERQPKALLQCLIDSLHCEPQINDIILNIDSSSIVVTFTQPTTMPAIDSISSWLHYFDIYPVPFGELSSNWTNPTSINITMDRDYQQQFLSHWQQKQSIFTLRKQSIDEKIFPMTSLTIRSSIQQTGRMNVFIFDKKSLLVISNIIQLTSTHCHSIPLPSSCSTDTNDILPVDSFHLRGGIPVTAQDNLYIPHDMIPGVATGNWSISMWMYLTKSKLIHNRQNIMKPFSLLYKGHLNDSLNHSPSIFMYMDDYMDSYLSLHVSSHLTADISGSTKLKLPHNEWFHLSFTFMNLTNAAASSRHHNHHHPTGGLNENITYVISTYINGALDSSMYFSVDIAGNDEPILLFNDRKYKVNPFLFVRDISIFNSTLNINQVNRLYKQGPVKAVKPSHRDFTAQATSLLSRYYLVTEGYITDDTLILQSCTTASRWRYHCNYDAVSELLLNSLLEGDICSSSMTARLDVYIESAFLGNLEALYYWAMLHYYGSEVPNHVCGLTSPFYQSPSDGLTGIDKELLPILAMLYLAERGYVRSLVPLAGMFENSINLLQLVTVEDADITVMMRRLPVKHDSNSIIPRLLDIIRGEMQEELDELLASITQRSLSLNSIELFPHQTRQSNRYSSIGYSISDLIRYTPSRQSSPVSYLFTSYALTFYQLAAWFQIDEAYIALSYRYSNGLYVSKCDETALYYAKIASRISVTEYHKLGAQPIMEGDRITDSTETKISLGNTGESDEMIQNQIIMAREGNIPAMVATGDLYYFGARGLPRDQIQALDYYNQAANLGNEQGMCNAAAMYLKGEGIPQANVSRAIELYETAVNQSNYIKALNGLGFLYFYGQHVPENKTKAFEYFNQAAMTESEPDSLFNAGYCLEHGVGTAVNLTQAIHYYEVAVNKFGNLDAAVNLGMMLAEGRGKQRSVIDSLRYLTAAEEIGPWNGWIRKGFNQYLLKHYDESVRCFVYASNLAGYEIGFNNAAFIIRRKMDKHSTTAATLTQLEWKMLLSSIYKGNTDNALFLGTIYMDEAKKRRLAIDGESESGDVTGYNHLVDDMLWWYSYASHKSNPAASLYLGLLYHYSDSKDGGDTIHNLDRAKRYYLKAISNPKLEYQLQWVTKALQWLLEAEQQTVSLKFIYHSLGFVIKKYFGLEGMVM